MWFEDFQDGRQLVAILDIGTECFSNFESPCGPNASHQALAQFDLAFQSRCALKIFKTAFVVFRKCEKLTTDDLRTKARA